MGWPQIAVIVMMTLGTGIHLARHGEQRDGRYNAVSALIGDVVLYGLLWAGGFFG